MDLDEEDNGGTGGGGGGVSLASFATRWVIRWTQVKLLLLAHAYASWTAPVPRPPTTLPGASIWTDKQCLRRRQTKRQDEAQTVVVPVWDGREREEDWH